MKAFWSFYSQFKKMSRNISIGKGELVKRIYKKQILIKNIFKILFFILGDTLGTF